MKAFFFMLALGVSLCAATPEATDPFAPRPLFLDQPLDAPIILDFPFQFLFDAPIGPVRIDYGKGLNRSQEFKSSDMLNWLLADTPGEADPSILPPQLASIIPSVPFLLRLDVIYPHGRREKHKID